MAWRQVEDQPAESVFPVEYGSQGHGVRDQRRDGGDRHIDPEQQRCEHRHYGLARQRQQTDEQPDPDRAGDAPAAHRQECRVSEQRIERAQVPRPFFPQVITGNTSEKSSGHYLVLIKFRRHGVNWAAGVVADTITIIRA